MNEATHIVVMLWLNVLAIVVLIGMAAWQLVSKRAFLSKAWLAKEYQLTALQSQVDTLLKLVRRGEEVCTELETVQERALKRKDEQIADLVDLMEFVEERFPEVMQGLYEKHVTDTNLIIERGEANLATLKDKSDRLTEGNAIDTAQTEELTETIAGLEESLATLKDELSARQQPWDVEGRDKWQGLSSIAVEPTLTGMVTSAERVAELSAMQEFDTKEYRRRIMRLKVYKKQIRKTAAGRSDSLRAERLPRQHPPPPPIRLVR